MFQLKALFVRLYFLAACLISGFCLWSLLQGEFIYIGVLLIWLPLPVIQTVRLKCNVAWGEERETPLLLPLLLGLASVLLSEQHFAAPLWLSLAGLFSLLLYLFVATATPTGVREGKGRRELLSAQAFTDAQGHSIQLSALQGQARLVIFIHSTDVYARMAVRQLKQTLERKAEWLTAEQVVLIAVADISALAGDLPPGVHLWRDTDSQGCEALGLLLRGGRWPLGDALRPTVAVQGSDGQVGFWSIASNYRVPTCLEESWPRLQRALTS